MLYILFASWIFGTKVITPEIEAKRVYLHYVGRGTSPEDLDNIPEFLIKFCWETLWLDGPIASCCGSSEIQHPESPVV